MVIISESEKTTYRGYGNTQFRYAMIYVIITALVLLLLNIYCSFTCQDLFYRSKKATMTDRVLFASDEISNLKVLNHTTISELLSEFDNLRTARMLVTDQSGLVLYDSTTALENQYAIFPEIIAALECNDVCTWTYSDGVIETRTAAPITYYDTVVGCVYLTEQDADQGGLIQTLQSTIFWITFFLESIVLIFSLAFSSTFSRRLRSIMSSMRIIQKGDYSHKVDVGGHDELTILGNEFNDLTNRLQDSEQKRSRFVSDASHELKTPLASIKLLSDSILQYDMDLETVREFVGDIGDEAERLNRMTAKLLSLTKAEGRSQDESEIIYMAPTVRRVARMLRQTALDAKISFDLQLAEDKPILILEDDLYQIIFNLMENGIKYNQRGGSLTVTLSHDEDNAYLSVTDTGMGIPEDALEHIFDRFYRVDKARSRATGGSGLGLSIVRTIIQRNRGDIQVASVVGKGTTFTVTFPAFDTEVDPE